MAIKRVSVNWTAKLNDSKDLPKYGDSGDGKFSKKFGEGRFVILAPTEVDSLIKKVPKGRLTTINALRTALSKKHQTDCLPDHHRDLLVDRRPRRRRAGPAGPQAHHAVLALAQERWPNQPEVPRRRRGEP